MMVLMLGLCLIASLPASAAALKLTAQEQAYLDSKPYLSVLALDTFPPFSFNDAGSIQGYSIDYMNKMGAVLDKEIRFVSGIPWFEALKRLRAGELDIIPTIAVTEERRAYINFTPYSHIEYVSAAVFHRDMAGKPLEGRIVAVAKNTFLHNYLKKNYPTTSVLTTATTDAAVLAVANGRADIAVGSHPSLNFYVQKHWLSHLTTGQIKGLDLPLRTSLPMGVQKGNDLLERILVKAQQAISYDQVSQLKEKWMRASLSTDMITGLTMTEAAFLNRHPELNLCIDPDWMPLEALRLGEYVGVSAELMAIVSKQLNLRFKPVPTDSWKESLRLGQEGACDIFPLIMPTEERRSFLDFTQPFVESPLVMITRVDAPYLSDLKYLQNKRIGVVSGYAINQALREQYPDLEFVDVASNEQGLSWVRDGKLYGYIDSLITSGYWIQNRYQGQLKVSSEIDRFWQLSMGVRKELQPLLSIMNKAISQISEAERQEVINRWVSIRYDANHDWLVTLVGILITILILGGVIVWYGQLNRRLQEEVSRRKEAEREALSLAQTDQLTGVLNRHGAEPIINQEMAHCRRYQTPVVMMILDIDHFKRINDTLGHKVGDDVLRWLSFTLRHAMRETDHLVRWGGEEFLILLPNTQLKDAEELAERYRQLIERGSDDVAAKLTVSLGIAQLNVTESFSQWYQRTDLALYQAKNKGRNCVVVSRSVHEEEAT